MEDKIPRMERSAYRIMGAIFLGVLGILVGLNVVKGDQKFSKEENRILEQAPEVSWNSITSGSYMKKYESYLEDQFIFRNEWMRLKTFMDSLIGKKESNGVFQGKNGYLMEDLQAFGEDTEKNIEAIQTFSEYMREMDVNVTLMFVPNAAYIWREYLPAYAPVIDQRKLLDELEKKLAPTLQYVDAASILMEHQQEYLYYRTDHHWTSLGAYYGFRAAADALKLEPDKEEYLEYSVTNQFTGTLASKSGYRAEADSITVYLNAIPQKRQVLVNYVEEKQMSTSLYQTEKLEEKDKYTVFLGGNYPHIEIKSLAESDRKLLLIKDSYANCFVPFLTAYFREIDLIDPRYYYGELFELMEQKQFTDILFLYNVNTFLEDNSLYSVLNTEE